MASHCLGLCQRDARLAAGPVDQTGAQALGIVEQNLEQVARLELRMALAHGEALGGLDEAAGAFGIDLEIHAGVSPPRIGLKVAR